MRGPSTSIGTVDAQGDLIQDKEELLALLGLAPAMSSPVSNLRKGVGVVTDVYADQGYAYANVSPLTRADDETRQIDLMLDIEQGPQVSVERINITGNTKTRDKVIRREMKLMEGDLFNATNLKKSKARINNLGFFEAVDISTSAGSDESLMNVDVNVKERSTGTFSVGAGYSSVDGVVGQGSITQENFLGRGLEAEPCRFSWWLQVRPISLVLPTRISSIRAGRWVLNVYQTDREWTDFSSKSKGFALKAGHPVGEYSRILVTYRLENKEIYDVESVCFITTSRTRKANQRSVP